MSKSMTDARLAELKEAITSFAETGRATGLIRKFTEAVTEIDRLRAEVKAANTALDILEGDRTRLRAENEQWETVVGRWAQYADGSKYGDYMADAAADLLSVWKKQATS